ncbi:unnamed protein product [Paramecium primaurelia]|uniref:H-type lectin domain-containing protein n=1 Tax=Paramecium primaurelia TaxID=5886 RepID=A0A8S1P0F9_PARPR|nr:unnamed protein product [Paramecium primaurelia]
MKISIILLFITVKCFIKYDTGYASSFDWNNGFSASGNNVYTKEFTFSGTFERIPQVAIIINKYNVQYQTTGGYLATITSITTTKFTVVMTNPYSSGATEMPFQWYAFDDKRVQVINEFNYILSSPYASFTQYVTYSHNNPNFTKALLFITSFQFKGGVDIVLSIEEITTTQVKVKIVSNTNNLLQIGYQIMLTTSDVMETTYIQQPSGSYTSSTMTFPTDKDWTVSTQGFNWPAVINFGVRLTKYSNYYTFAAWSGNPINALRFTYITIVKSITQTFLPMAISGIRVSQKENYNNSPLPTVQLSFEELSLVYTSETSQTFYVQSSLSQLNVIIQYKCPTTQKLYTELNYPNQIIKRNFYCSRSQNIVTMYIRINSQMIAINEITFSLTNTGISIKQNVQNQLAELKQIFLLQITNN